MDNHRAKPRTNRKNMQSGSSLLIESLQLEPFVLAGHSLGGIIAQQFARMFPEILRGLMLIGTGMRFEIQQEYLDMLDQDFNTACLISCRQAYAAHMPSDMLERGLAMLRRNGPEVLLRDLSLCADFDSTAWAQTLTMPCLIICGKQDAITPCALSHAACESHSRQHPEIDSMNPAIWLCRNSRTLFNKEISLFIEKHCRVTR